MIEKYLIHIWFEKISCLLIWLIFDLRKNVCCPIGQVFDLREIIGLLIWLVFDLTKKICFSIWALFDLRIFLALHYLIYIWFEWNLANKYLITIWFEKNSSYLIYIWFEKCYLPTPTVECSTVECSAIWYSVVRYNQVQCRECNTVGRRLWGCVANWGVILTEDSSLDMQYYIK